jgi:hypothetical protein
MATNIDTALTAQTATRVVDSPHIFTMSDGNLVAIYWNGTNWGYRIKTGAGWGSRTTLTSSPTGTTTSSWCRNGDSLYGAVGGTNARVYRLLYNPTTDAITMSSAVTGDGSMPIIGAYWDSTNSRFWFCELLPDYGPYAYSTNATLAGMFGEDLTGVNSPPATGDPSLFTTFGLGSTLFLAWVQGTTVKVTRVTLGTTASATTEVAETGVPALAATGQALSGVYDGTNYVLIAQENNAKVRRSRRTAANTYDSWSDVVTATVDAGVSINKSSSDLAVLYASGGDAMKVQRISGTWESSGTLVATGGAYPSGAGSDLNQATAGDVPILYVTGASSPWTLVEDLVSITGGGGATVVERSASLSATAAISAAGTFWTTFQRATALDTAATIAVSAYRRDHQRQAALTAAAAVTVAGQRVHARQTSVSATAAVTATGEHVHARQASLTAAASIAAAPQRELQRSSALTATASIATAPQRDLERQASLTAATGVTVSGEIEGVTATFERSAALTAAAAVTVTDSERDHVRSATLQATAATSAAGLRIHQRAAALTATTSIQAAAELEGVTERSASLTAATSLQAAHQRELQRQAALTTAAVITAAHQRALQRTVALTATSGIASTGGAFRILERALALNALASISTAGLDVPPTFGLVDGSSSTLTGTEGAPTLTATIEPAGSAYALID